MLGLNVWHVGQGLCEHCQVTAVGGGLRQPGLPQTASEKEGSCPGDSWGGAGLPAEQERRGRDGTHGGEGKAGVPPERSHVSLSWLRLAGAGTVFGKRDHSFIQQTSPEHCPHWELADGLGRPSPPVRLFSSNLCNQLTIPPKISSSHTLRAPFIRGSPGAGYRLRTSH